MYVADMTSLFGPFVKFVVEEVGGGYTVVNPRRECAALGLCVCLSQSNLRSCANTRATRNIYGFSVTRIVKKSRFLKKCFVQKLESYLLTVAKSAIFCAFLYTRARVSIARALGSWAGHV